MRNLMIALCLLFSSHGFAGKLDLASDERFMGAWTIVADEFKDQGGISTEFLFDHWVENLDEACKVVPAAELIDVLEDRHLFYSHVAREDESLAEELDTFFQKQSNEYYYCTEYSYDEATTIDTFWFSIISKGNTSIRFTYKTRSL